MRLCQYTAISNIVRSAPLTQSRTAFGYSTRINSRTPSLQNKLIEVGNRPHSVKHIYNPPPFVNIARRQASSSFHTTTTVLLSERDTLNDAPPPPPLLDARTYMNDKSSTNKKTIPMPKALSPSSASCFKQCPQSYLFQYLFNIRQPTNQALAKGSMCHSALEKVFELEPKDRTLENLQNLLRKVWSQKRLTDEYRHLFHSDNDNDNNNDNNNDNDVRSTTATGEDLDRGQQPERDLEAEKKWGMEGLRLLVNYFDLEDPRLVPRPNPIEREVWVNAKLTVNPSLGVTGNVENSGVSSDDSSAAAAAAYGDTFLVRGIVDRLDYVAAPPSPRSRRASPDTAGVLRIIDYKTGKAPNFKYSPAMNEKIANDTTWQLKIYALLLREMTASSTRSKSGNLQNLSGEEFRLLRLMYLTSSEPNGIAKYLDMDLGETQEERDELLQEVHVELADIWKNILNLVETQDPREFAHCDKKWCFCHTARARFVPESVYTRP